MGPHASSIDAQVTQRVAQKGAVFAPADLLDLGSRNAADLALSRRARAGTIRKLSPRPVRHPADRHGTRAARPFD